MTTVLVTGGTGLLGRTVVAQLAAAGHDARILTRATRGGPYRSERVVGDLTTGAGLEAAVDGVAAIVHLASDPRHAQRVDVAGTRRLIEAAHRAGRPHLVYVSIVGVDRIPWRYYGAKAIVEQDVAAPGYRGRSCGPPSSTSSCSTCSAGSPGCRSFRHRGGGGSSPSTWPTSRPGSWRRSTTARAGACPTSAAPTSGPSPSWPGGTFAPPGGAAPW